LVFLSRETGVNALLEFAKAIGGRYYKIDEGSEFVRDIKELCTLKHGTP